MSSSVAFTQSFFRPLPVNDTPGPSEPTAQTEAPLIYSFEKHGAVEAFIHSSRFNTFRQEYEQVLDNIAAFVEHHADDFDPPLSAETRKEVKDDFEVLKQHLFDAQEDYFGPHKPEVYGVGKEMFHAFANLLQEKHVPLQQRMNAVLTLSSRARVCAGGLLSDLQDVTAVLKGLAHGLRGVAYQWKIKMMEALIFQHVKANHEGYAPIWEIHYVNAYYNKLADLMGVRERPDVYARELLNNGDVSEENVNACMEHVFAKMKPTQMAADLASQYRSYIEESLNKENIAADNIGLDDFNKLNTVMQALKPEYGDVGTDALLEQPDPDNSELYAYMGRKQSIRSTRHFMKALRQQEMISYDKKSKLVLGHTDEERIVMLDDMFWVKQQGKDKRDSIYREFTASSLFKLAPEDLLNTLKEKEPLDVEARNALLRKVIQHAHKSLEAAGNMKDELGAWLHNFAAVMARKKHPLLRRSSWQGDWSDPVILLAAAFGQAPALDKLLHAGGNQDAADENGRTALILAAQGGHAEVAKTLIRQKANIEAKDHEGNTALVHAVRQNKVDVVQALLVAGADKEVKGAGGYTPLQEAAIRGQVGVVEALLKRSASKEAADEQGRTALMLAAENGHVKVVEALLKAEAYKEARDEHGRTALMLAVENGHVKVVEALLKAKANKGTRDTNRNTPLTLAAVKGHVQVVEALLKAEANGVTALLELAQQDSKSALSVLIKAGADKAKDAQGKTALMRAVEMTASENERDSAKGLQILNALLDAGADTGVMDNEGKTAEAYAKRVAGLGNAKALLSIAPPVPAGGVIHGILRAIFPMIRQ